MVRIMIRQRAGTFQNFSRAGVCLATMALLLSVGCGMEDEPPQGLVLEEDTEVRLQQLSPFCTVQLEGYGAVDVEEDYLPSVVACENGNAPMEALKAQAIAARTYALFMSEDLGRPLFTDERHQVYDCSYAQPEERHYEAVRATAGQVLTHGDHVIAPFYVAGAVPRDASCVGEAAPNTVCDGAGTQDTERCVTYNEGLMGNEIHRSPQGHPGNPANRGTMSQNGSSCLSDQGWDYERILRFYYGDDARARVAEGSQCAGDGSGGGAVGDDEPMCSDPSTDPNIRPRSAWDARTATRNRAHHTPDRITVHHTVQPNGESDGAYWVRSVQNGHMDERDYWDIGYHFLISWDGTIYRGNPEDRQGAHVLDHNSGNLGISLIGNYEEGEPSEEQLASLAQMLRYLGDKYDIELDRDHVGGHRDHSGHSSNLCPGASLYAQLDDLLERAQADANCSGGESSDEPEAYHYVKVTGVSAEPTTDDDPVDGFEVDSISVERPTSSGTHHIQAASVTSSSGVSNAGAALGEPDNSSCDNRTQTVAGVSVGGELVVRMNEAVHEGDILKVTQHRYFAANSACSPTGTAKVSVSKDGRVWKVLDDTVSGNWLHTLDADAFIIDQEDETGDPKAGLTSVSPTPGNWYHPDVSFSALVTDSSIVEVEYLADGWKMGGSSNGGTNFAFDYEFQNYGERVIEVRGLDSSGAVVATHEFTVTITDYSGTIPPGQTTPPTLPDSDAGDATAAERLAEEAGKCWDHHAGGDRRCTDGVGGPSLRLCWRYVKRAMERAEHNYMAIKSTGPCSWSRVQLSAYGFRCNADPNPGVLRDEVGFERIDVPPTEAPRGAVISWHKGCAGFSSLHGHIEVAMGDGTACSDYCGNIRSGGQSCSSVYVPVSN